MQVTDLKAILDYEHNEQWLAALNCYKGIWDHNPTDDVAIRYCFFCWYLIWQWEQIDFPGEDISFEAKITVDNRMGISKAELEHMLWISLRSFKARSSSSPKAWFCSGRGLSAAAKATLLRHGIFTRN